MAKRIPQKLKLSEEYRRLVDQFNEGEITESELHDALAGMDPFVGQGGGGQSGRRKPKAGVPGGSKGDLAGGKSAASGGADWEPLHRSVRDLESSIKELTTALRAFSPGQQEKETASRVQSSLAQPAKGFHQQWQAGQKRAPKVDISTATSAVTEIMPPDKPTPPTLPATSPTPPKDVQAMWEKAQSRAPKLNPPPSLTPQPPKLASSGVTLPGPSAGKDEGAMEDLTEQVKRLADLMEKQKDKEAKPFHEQWQVAQSRAPKLDVEPPEFRGGRSQASPSRPGRG